MRCVLGIGWVDIISPFFFYFFLLILPPAFSPISHHFHFIPRLTFMSLCYVIFPQSKQAKHHNYGHRDMDPQHIPTTLPTYTLHCKIPSICSIFLFFIKPCYVNVTKESIYRSGQGDVCDCYVYERLLFIYPSLVIPHLLVLLFSFVFCLVCNPSPLPSAFPSGNGTKKGYDIYIWHGSCHGNWIGIWDEWIRFKMKASKRASVYLIFVFCFIPFVNVRSIYQSIKQSNDHHFPLHSTLF